jgi:hypothetical protein
MQAIRDITTKLNNYIQENTKVTKQTSQIATKTNDIASKIVENVAKNSFEGKSI